MVLETSPRRRSPLPLVMAVVIGLAAIIGIYLVLKPGGKSGGGAGASRGDCVALTVAASSEKSALLTELATGYNSSDRTFGGRCADVKIVSKASGAAMEALAAGWDPARDGGPPPQVWTPAASSWVSLLRQRAASGDRATLVGDAKPASIAQTPLVLAMPKPMAEALGWPGKPLGWSDVLGLTNDPKGWGAVGHPEWGSFRLGKTNPHYSTSGLNATVGSYFAATGRSSDLTAADLADPKVGDFVKGVEAGVVHYGDTTLTFLSNLAAADARGQGMNYISAVAVEEKSVYDYNQGNPTGDPKLAGKGQKPRVPLVAVYPKEGTLVSDNPYVVLATASDEQKAAAEDFLKYLQSPERQRRFTDAAFRSFDGKPGSVLSQANGLLPGQELNALDVPASAVLDKALQTWDSQRKRARVLLVLDVSGSMGDLTSNGKSKLEVAKQAGLRAVDLFAPDDEVGLWTFSSEVRGASTPYTEQVPIGPVAANSGRLKQTINSMAADGGTALYATTRAAQQKLLSAATPDRINAVVLLTDGKNEYNKDSDLNGLLRDLDASNLENSVRVFTIAYGDKADLDTLKRISSSSRAAAYDARNPISIDSVLVNVISNF
ncbi:substrate-binding and vWA domain-containing protein [Planosporangium mesophilum]|uniref:VWA domain-containing protein n=1 Tax=Planosporangium mesophilum TaxID=689768 RepID=A0A8J3T631_9ACTN|nr:substrate-binding and VWA domain-containing protein [Planosporangium mesophilum]GII20574.1 VWA domain-containing protein [Planosporangium mesophilum]